MDLSKLTEPGLTESELKDLYKLQANIIANLQIRVEFLEGKIYKLESRNFWQRLKYLLTNK